ncbi:SCAN domain-containing protein 3 [Trichonephila clavipes]|nr:SCAN domain-containing protein 3 [Trichonephila clavipes]
MYKVRKTPVGLECPAVSSEECIAVDEDNVCTTPIMADKDILEFVESSKNIFEADSDHENEINNVPTSSEMKSHMDEEMIPQGRRVSQPLLEIKINCLGRCNTDPIVSTVVLCLRCKKIVVDSRGSPLLPSPHFSNGNVMPS